MTSFSKSWKQCTQFFGTLPQSRKSTTLCTTGRSVIYQNWSIRFSHPNFHHWTTQWNFFLSHSQPTSKLDDEVKCQPTIINIFRAFSDTFSYLLRKKAFFHQKVKWRDDRLDIFLKECSDRFAIWLCQINLKSWHHNELKMNNKVKNLRGNVLTCPLRFYSVYQCSKSWRKCLCILSKELTEVT